MAGDKCYVCKIRKKRRSEEYIGFFRFPKCNTRRKQWCEILNLTLEDFDSDKTNSRGKKLCSRHFSPDSINFTYAVPRLRDNALPEISVNEALKITTESTPDNNEGSVCDSTVLEAIEFDSGVFYFSKKRPISRDQEQEEVSGQTCQSSDENGEEKKPEETREVRKVDRETSVSPERIINCPTTEAIRNYYKEELEDEKEARRNMCRNLYLSQRRNAVLHNVVSKLRSHKFLDF
ncbi:uncharacterized protein LOC117167559 isoform X2 [Belonocnema kinseyi]|uniref:uncharacterized protein LOC117167559 isoform X2 n=1 Tax=Belonocnema kinseyi TaxID=2817044 RepID=UPI00143D2B38|nr:uncharacterized protein LOC117167559 isoform X2 [Belonocnema kinseyi]